MIFIHGYVFVTVVLQTPVEGVEGCWDMYVYATVCVCEWSLFPLCTLKYTVVSVHVTAIPYKKNYEYDISCTLLRYSLHMVFFNIYIKYKLKVTLFVAMIIMAVKGFFFKQRKVDTSVYCKSKTNLLAIKITRIAVIYIFLFSSIFWNSFQIRLIYFPFRNIIHDPERKFLQKTKQAIPDTNCLFLLFDSQLSLLGEY